MDNGFIILHRKLTEWQWYQDGNTMRLFLHLLLKANHKKGYCYGVEINRGQHLTGRKILSKDLRLTEQQVRTSLVKLEKSGNITIKTTNKHSIIEVINYNEYQQNNQQITNKQPTDNQQTTTNNNDNNDNNDNKMLIFSEENYKINNTAYLLKAFYSLGYTPSKTETLEKFRLWFKEKIIDKHNFKNSNEINSIIDNFESYWSESDKKVKNFKSTFLNNPLLQKYGK